MNKKYWHHLWTNVRPIKTFYLFLTFLLCLTVAVLALRDNYATMVELREAVYQADRESGDVEGALQALRAHVNTHMNTNLSSGAGSVYPPIQLKETYRRLQQVEQAKLEASNAELYTQAQRYCEQRHPDTFTGGPRVPCIEAYVTERGVTVKPIPDGLYKFDFASPSWSPDLAGWSLVLSAVLLILTLLRFVFGRVAKRFF